MNKFKLMFAVFIVAAITGCSKAPGETPASAPATLSAEEQKTPTLAREAIISQEKYIPVSMGWVNQAQLATQVENMRALFWNGAPMDLEALADDFVPEYKDEKDTFRRSDLAKANKALLDVAYRNARKNPYFSVKFDKELGSIKKYDPVIKGFHVSPMSLGDGMSYQWSRPEGKGRNYNGFWGVRLLGADSFDYIPASEDEARKIEAALAQRRGGADTYNSAIIVYGRVVGYNKEEFEGDKTRRIALVRVDGMSFVDNKTNEVLLTADRKMLPKEIKFDSTIKADYFASATR